jgi:hypothetical protein
MQLKELEISTANFLSWIGETNLAYDRPDVVALYYPFKYNFIWFTSKTDFYLRQNIDILPVHWRQIQNHLHTMLTNQATSTILKLAQNKYQLTFWDDFLGDADVNPITHNVRADDRLYSTAVNVNALINILADLSAQGDLQWALGTPKQVKQTVAQSGKFLELFANLNWYHHENVFFAGPVVDPLAYFANSDTYLDGTTYIKDKNLSTLRVYGVAGRADEYDYTQWLSAHPSNNVFQPFNTYSPFPYWSATSFTDSTILLALVKIGSLEH